MEIKSVQRKIVNFGDLECGDLFMVNREIFIKAYIPGGLDCVYGGVELKGGKFVGISDVDSVGIINAHLQLED